MSKELNKEEIFRVPKLGGVIDFVSLDEALADIVKTEVFDAETATEVLTEGKKVASEEYFYCAEASELSIYANTKAEDTENKPVEPANVPDFTLAQQEPKDADIQVGDTVKEDGTERIGTVFAKVKEGGVTEIRVKFLDADGRAKSVMLSPKWQKIDPATIKLAKAGKAVTVAEVVAPLTTDEKEAYEEAVKTIKKAFAQAERIPLVLGANFAKLIDGKLFRTEAPTFEAWFKKNFPDYHVKYALNLAQAARTKALVETGLDEGEKLQLNATAGQALAVQTNKFANAIGLSDAELRVLLPVFQQTAKLLVNTAPEVKGKKVVTPLHIEKFTEQLNDIATQQVVELDGKQMSISEAKDKGLLGVAFTDQVITAVSEGIKAKQEFIADKMKEQYERTTKPVTISGTSATKGSSANVEFYTGQASKLTVKCTNHGNTKIEGIGNGNFQADCKCRFRIDNGTGLLVCFEVEGKPVKI